MNAPKTHEGGCQCGRVRYRVHGRPNNTTNCYCAQCRMASGAPVIAWSEFPAEAVTFTRERPACYRSSDAAERGFCPTCGTTLTFCTIDGEAIDIATATLDDPSVFSPQDHLWVASKVPWHTIGEDGLARFPRHRGSAQ